MQTRLIYGSISATTAGVFYVELPFNARIKCIGFAVTPTTTPASGDYIACEVSISPTNQSAGVQDAIGVLAIFSHAFGVVTSGSGIAANGWFPCDHTVKAGERIYLNATEVGTQTYQVRVLLVLS
jgi:hypothetical protein